MKRVVVTFEKIYRCCVEVSVPDNMTDPEDLYNHIADDSVSEKLIDECDRSRAWNLDEVNIRTISDMAANVLVEGD